MRVDTNMLCRCKVLKNVPKNLMEDKRTFKDLTTDEYKDSHYQRKFKEHNTAQDYTTQYIAMKYNTLQYHAISDNMLQ